MDGSFSMNSPGANVGRGSTLDFNDPRLEFSVVDPGYVVEEEVKNIVFSYQNAPESQKVYSQLLMTQLEEQRVRVVISPRELPKSKPAPVDPQGRGNYGKGGNTSIEREIYPRDSLMSALLKTKGTVVEYPKLLNDTSGEYPLEVGRNNYLFMVEKFDTEYVGGLRRLLQTEVRDKTEMLEMYHFEAYVVQKGTNERVTRAMHFDQIVTMEGTRASTEQQFLLEIPQYYDPTELILTVSFQREYNPRFEDIFATYCDGKVNKGYKKIRKFEGFADGFGDVRVMMGYFHIPLVDLIDKQVGDFEEVKREVLITRRNELYLGAGVSGKNKFKATLDLMVGEIPDEEKDSVEGVQKVPLFNTVPRNDFLSTFVHNIFIYPGVINFEKDLLCKVVLRHTDIDVYNDNENLNVFRRKTYDGEKVNSVYTSFLTNQFDDSTFYDEIQLDLPLEMITEKTHLLFLFYKVNPKKKKEFLKLFAYTTLNVLQNKSTLIDGNFELDVVTKLKSVENYVAISEKTKSTLSHMKKKKRNTFTVKVVSNSTVYPKEFHLQAFLVGIVQQSARWAHKNLLENLDKKFGYYVQVFPLIMEYMLYSFQGIQEPNDRVVQMENFVNLIDKMCSLAQSSFGDKKKPLFLVRFMEEYFANKTGSPNIVTYPFWFLTESVIGVFSKESEGDQMKIAFSRCSWFFFHLIYRSFALASHDPIQNIPMWFQMLSDLLSQCSGFILKQIRLIGIQVKEVDLNKARGEGIYSLNESIGFLMRRILIIVKNKPRGFNDKIFFKSYFGMLRGFREENVKYPKLCSWIGSLLFRICEILVKDTNTLPLLFLRFDDAMGIDVACSDFIPDVLVGNMILDEICLGLFQDQQNKRKLRMGLLLEFLTLVDRNSAISEIEGTTLFTEVIFASVLNFVVRLEDYYKIVDVEIQKLQDVVDELVNGLDDIEDNIADGVSKLREQVEKPQPLHGEKMNISLSEREMKAQSMSMASLRLKKRAKAKPRSLKASEKIRRHITLKSQLELAQKQLDDLKSKVAEREKDNIFYIVLSVFYQVDQDYLAEVILNSQDIHFEKLLKFCFECFELFFFDPRSKLTPYSDLSEWEKKFKLNCAVMLFKLTTTFFENHEKFEGVDAIKGFSDLCEYFLKLELFPFFHLRVIDIFEVLFVTFKSEFFESKNEGIISFLETLRTRLILLLISSTNNDVKQKTTELFFKMAMHDYSLCRNINITIIQTISTISKLEKNMTNEVVETLERFGEDLYNLSENEEEYAKDAKFVECFEIFFEKIRDILGHVINVKKFRNENNSAKMISTMFRLVEDDTSLLLKFIWLENLSTLHEGETLRNYAESAMCNLVRVAYIYKYFEKVEKHWICQFIPFDLLKECCPYLSSIDEGKYEKLLESLGSLSTQSKNELRMNVEGVIALIEKSVKLFERANLMEYCSILSDLLVRYYRSLKDHQKLISLFQKMANYHERLAKYKTQTKDDAKKSLDEVNRYFPRYYYVMILLAGKFKEDQNQGNGIELVFKTPKLTTLGDFMEILRNAYKTEFGEENIVIESYVKLGKFKNEVLMNRENLRKAYFFVQCLNVLEKESDLPYNPISEFENNTNVKKFAFEVRMKNPKMIEKKSGNDLLDYLIHIMTVEVKDAFPFLRLDSTVCGKSISVRSPIQSAVEMLKKSVNNLNKELSKVNPMMSSLTMVIQGSVIPTVQQGIGLVVDTFLVKKMELSTPEDQIALRTIKRLLGEFLVVSLKCIEKYSGMIVSVNQWQFLKEFLKGYELLFKLLTKHLKNDPDFGLDLFFYLTMYHELVAKSKNPPKKK